MGPPDGGRPIPIRKITNWKRVSTALEKIDTPNLNSIPNDIASTDEIDLAIALRRASAYPTPEYRSRARALQREVKARVREFRNESWSDLMEEIKPSHKAFWRSPPRKGLIIDEQFGFRPAHSCPQQVLRLVEYVSEGFETERSTVAVFDVAKAFDRHERTHSTRRLIRAGVPQGSTLSLCCTCVHKRCTATVVVWRPTRDDSALFTEIGIGAPDSPSSLQRAIDELGQWFRKWRIEVNPTNQQPYNSSMVIDLSSLLHPAAANRLRPAGGREPTRDGFLRHPMPRRLPPGVVHSACHAPSALACVRPHSVKLSKSSDLSSDSSRPTK
ncbi:hypothetical protein EVAR_51694_1 [Eumeta japonica]|uniref:Uncharacterized protein n=1 Tax=Eumeta variegata TaxID=151549 RepID=A0A4C1XHU8_EUMVA|nr:hypothetical protein EVAR_51694_1 [Eumeta japonica]